MMLVSCISAEDYSASLEITAIPVARQVQAPLAWPSQVQGIVRISVYSLDQCRRQTSWCSPQNVALERSVQEYLPPLQSSHANSFASTMKFPTPLQVLQILGSRTSFMARFISLSWIGCTGDLMISPKTSTFNQ